MKGRNRGGGDRLQFHAGNGKRWTWNGTEVIRATEDGEGETRYTEDVKGRKDEERRTNGCGGGRMGT